jgi:dihydrofolate synthase/folylpolyglutamate synthase
MRFKNETEAITYVFQSLAATNWQARGLDEHTRDTAPTTRLLALTGLPALQREYAVVTGSKGKGSVTAITARLLQSLGHTVGMITSPHLTTYRQRFRVNGRMISEADLIRHIDALAPAIDSIHERLHEGQYLSPQGIFLAVALRWFDEQGVTAAVIEIGRGGRFDDNAIVPNRLSLFTPILLEHTRYLGPTVERIAWHKAGIIKPQSYAYSLPQSPEVMEVLRREAESHDAQFEWLAPADMGQYIADTERGMTVDFGRYGVVEMPLMGRYEIDNASLAIWAAGNMHARLPVEPPLPHGSAAYVAHIRHGLENVIWPGRCEKLQDHPAVYIDGAINTLSARIYIDSVRNRLTHPVITVLAVPRDRDFKAVYGLFAPVSDAIILTETSRNVTIAFPDPQTALAAAREVHAEVSYQPTVESALRAAIEQAGATGSVLMSVAQPVIGDVMALYDRHYEQI